MNSTSLVLLLLGVVGSCDGDGDGKEDTGWALVVDQDGDTYPYAEDCDDLNPDVHPDAEELCDGMDNDCDEEVDEGVQLTWYADNDGDGFGNALLSQVGCEKPTGYVPNAEDCDDENTNAFPGNPEVCDAVDNDCDNEVDEDVAPTWYADADGDGYGDATMSQDSCQAPEGWLSDGTDCDDTRASVNPAATEICDGLDNDCDNEVDEEVTSTWYVDSDGDGQGSTASTVEGCEPPPGYTGNTDDCDDASDAVYEGAPEICDGRDNDCDDLVDESDAVDATSWYEDADGDGHGTSSSTVVSCDPPEGWVGNDDDCDDADATTSPDSTEACNGKDDDCDGVVDEPDATDAGTWYHDGDGDGYGDASGSQRSCEPPDGYVANDDDCDDGAAAVSPAGTEVCNGIDDDCDGFTDESTATDASTWYHDADGDGYGSAATTTVSCDPPADYVPDGTDCDDTAASSHPGGTEVCNGEDDDCDGVVDEADAVDAGTWYADADGDGYGSGATSTVACDAPDGYVANDDDCDDATSAASPGHAEVCDGIDNDCDGSIDEGATDAATWYHDADGDGHGDGSSSTASCSPPPGYTSSDDDCDDTEATVYPGHAEVCDGLDNDCDGSIDEGATDAATWYRDSDGDGYGTSSTSVTSCTRPSGYVSNDDDCNDAASAVNPAQPEICDGIDNDCDGSVDEGATDATTWYRDADGDGYGSASTSTTTCTRPSGYVTNDDDCNDASALALPGGTEVCDGLDNDCDGRVDDDPTDGTTWYEDADGDGLGDPSSTQVACDTPVGYTDIPYDCDDTDPGEPVVVDIATGSTSGDGSRDHPVDSIQDGVTLASECVVVFPGTYEEQVDLSGKSIDLWGVDGPSSTVIDAGLSTCTSADPLACAAAVTIADDSGAAPTVHGFTITGGTGHVSHTTSTEECADSTPGGEDCTVDIYEYCGGGVYVKGDDPTLYDVILQHNDLPEFLQEPVGEYAQIWIYSFGGGLCNAGGNVTLLDAYVLDNFADQGGGLYATDDGTLSVNHAVVMYNEAVDGGGINLDDATLTSVAAIYGCNAAETDGGGLFLQTALTSAYLVNTVLFSDTSALGTTHGAAVYGASATRLTLTNTIVQTAIASYALYGAGSATLTYNDVYNSASTSYRYGGSYTAGATDIASNPLFEGADCDGDAFDDDFHLAAGSPAIDAGHPGSPFNDPDGSRNDMGAYGGPDGDW